MALRLGGLGDLDPEAVPLPAGTEVTTRVDRVVGGEVRTQGASGRWVARAAGAWGADAPAPPEATFDEQ